VTAGWSEGLLTPNGVMVGVPDLTEADLIHLRRCVELASEAVDAGELHDRFRAG